MELIERLIAGISPQWAAKRAHYKRVFDAAQASHQYKSRNDTRAPNAIMDHARDKLRNITRHLDENHDRAVGVLDALANNVVGAGITVEPMVKLADGRGLAKNINNELRDLWAEWSENPEVTGQYTRGELERGLLRAWMRDGEVFPQHLQGPQYGDFGYQVRVMEADYLPFDLNQDRPRIIHGVEKDSLNRPVRYHFYRTHPGEILSYGAFPSLNLDTVSMPAEQVIHLKYTRRFHQTRGQPRLHAVIRRMESLHEYEESEQIAARVAADFTGFIQRSPDMVPIAAGDDERHIQMQSGAIFELNPGESVGSLEAKRPNPDMNGFVNTLTRAVAAGTGTTFSQISRDYSQGNYSSQRQELVESYASYTVLQNYFIAKATQAIYRRWVQTLRATNKVKARRFYALDLRMASEADFTAPVLPWIDPEKEAKAYAVLLENDLESRHAVIRLRGRNPAVVDQQIEDDPLRQKREEQAEAIANQQQQPQADAPEESEDNADDSDQAA